MNMPATLTRDLKGSRSSHTFRCKPLNIINLRPGDAYWLKAGSDAVQDEKPTDDSGFIEAPQIFVRGRSVLAGRWLFIPRAQATLSGSTQLPMGWTYSHPFSALVNEPAAFWLMPEYAAPSHYEPRKIQPASKSLQQPFWLALHR